MKASRFLTGVPVKRKKDQKAQNLRSHGQNLLSDMSHYNFFMFYQLIISLNVQNDLILFVPAPLLYKRGFVFLLKFRKNELFGEFRNKFLIIIIK